MPWDNKLGTGQLVRVWSHEDYSDKVSPGGGSPVSPSSVFRRHQGPSSG